MNIDMETTVLNTLMKSPEYFGTAYTFLKPEHFTQTENITIFEEIQKYMKAHSVRPTIKDVGLQIKNSNTIVEQVKQLTLKQFKEIATQEPITNIKPFLKITENFIQKQELTKAIFASADIIKTDKEFDPIIGMISDALKISFDTDVGHIYNLGIEERMDYYTTKLRGLTTGASSLDRLLGGGIMSKALTVIAGASHSGKSAFMASIAAANLLKQKNVLFVTLEMSDLESAKRIDCNILDLDINEFKNSKKETVTKQFNAVKDILGQLVVKEYGAGTFNTLHLENLLTELSNEKGFTPDLIVIDYMGLMSSSRGVTLAGTGGNSNTVGTAIAEELHSFSKTWDIPVLSAVQLNRSAYGNMDAGMEAVAGAIGVSQTADVMIAMVSTPEMKEMNQVVAKLIKNRNTGQLSSLMMKVEYNKMRYSDWDEEVDGQIQSTEQQIQTLSKEDLGLVNPTGGLAISEIDVGSFNFG